MKGYLEMSDNEKLIVILNEFQCKSIDDILNRFLEVYGDDIDIRDIYALSKVVNRHLETKINAYDRLKFVANERARYIKMYLEGKMWPTEELAKAYLQPQIDNIHAIIDACDYT